MKYYIECYYDDGTQILGNLCGQGVIHAKDYKRTNQYKRIVHIVKSNPTKTRVAFAKIVTETGQVVEIIDGR